MNISWLQIAKWLGSSVPTGFASLPPPLMTKINTDSRAIKPGDFFLPLPGSSFDGHAFIEGALQQGAAGFFYEERSGLSAPLRVRGWPVADTLKAYQDLALGYRREFRIPIISLTASSGKTTVKEMVRQILANHHKVLATEANFNNEIGVPKTLLQLTADHAFCVLEMGARHPGDIHFLCQIAEPTVRCLLNVGNAHLGEFGTRERLLATKAEIFATPVSSDVLVVNRDDDAIWQTACNKPNPIMSFGYHKEASVRIEAFTPKGLTGELQLRILGQPLVIPLSSLHETHPMNMAAAVAMAHAVGLKPEAMVSGLAAFGGVDGRFKTHALKGYTVIDDSYNANPQSMRAGLDTLRRYYPKEHKVIVLGDMLELGEESERLHYELGELVGTMPSCFLVTVGEHSRKIQEAAQASGLAPTLTQHFRDVDEAIAQLDSIAKGSTLLYAKGSNGIKLKKLVSYALDKHNPQHRG